MTKRIYALMQARVDALDGKALLEPVEVTELELELMRAWSEKVIGAPPPADGSLYWQGHLLVLP